MVVKLIARYNSISLLKVNPSSRCETSWSSSSNFVISKHTSHVVSFGAKIANTSTRKLVVYANSVPGVPPPTGSNPKTWILGLVITFVLQFFSNKWGPLWVLKNRIDGAVQIVENVAEIVEHIAEQVDKVVEDIADDLPEGKLKTLMVKIDDMAEKTAQAADALDDAIDKVQEAEESFVESLDEESKKSYIETKEASGEALEAEISSMIQRKVSFVEPPVNVQAQNWFLEIFMSFILPFFGNKLGTLWQLKNRLTSTIQTVENIAETVEKVAEEVDKIAEEISDDLPAGKLKDLVDLVEDVADKTAKTADSLDDIVDKVQEADDHLDDIVESIVKGDKEKGPKKLPKD